jgi:hypothetical protein
MQGRLNKMNKLLEAGAENAKDHFADTFSGFHRKNGELGNVCK